MSIYCPICGKEKPKQNKTCSGSCGTKLQWLDKDRLEKQRQRWKEYNKNDSRFQTGRPRGAKNKNPYPKSAAVQKRNENYKTDPRFNTWTDKKHSEETRSRMSETWNKKFADGYKVTSAMKGFFRCKHPEKYKGNPTQIVYRSSWELKYMMNLDHDPLVLEWSSEEKIIAYSCPITGRVRRYFPDFYVKKKSLNGNITETIVEIKPAYQCVKPKPPKDKKKEKTFLKEAAEFATNISKWEAAKKYCEHRGWEFKILTEKELNIPTYKKPIKWQ